MKSSVQQFARELDRLCRNNIPMSQAFDMLENTAKSYGLDRDQCHERFLQ